MFENLYEFVTAYPVEATLSTLGVLFANIIYALTDHPSRLTPTAWRLLNVLLGLLSFVKSNKAGLKLPLYIEGLIEHLTKPRGGHGPGLLLAVSLLAAGGCTASGGVDWNKVLSAGGWVIKAGQAVTPVTCEGMALFGAGDEHLQRCKKANDFIQKKLGPGYSIGAGLAGTWANAPTVNVPGVGPVKAMSIIPATLPGQPPAVNPNIQRPIGYRIPTTAAGGAGAVDTAPIQETGTAPGR